MARVQIVTDSAVRFTIPSFHERYQIALAPMAVRCGSVTFVDDPEADLSAVYHYLEDPHTTPKAKGPSVEQLATIYSQKQTESDKIISIHTSSGLCDAVVNAVTASRQFLGRVEIQVIDSQTASVGLGLLVQAVAEAAAQGADIDTLVRIARGMIPRLYLVYFLNDLFYLEQNGLASRSQAILGNMLGIIPFLTMEEGRMMPMEKVRSRPRAVEKLIEFVCEFSAIEHLAILHNSPSPTQECLSIAERLRAFHPDTPISSACYGPFISTFVGADSTGVVVLEAEEQPP
jgi:DegV family protein with EDD domain